MAKPIDAAKREAGEKSAKKHNTKPCIYGANIGTMWLQMERNPPFMGGHLIKIGIDGVDPYLSELRDYARDEHGIEIDVQELMDFGYCEASVEPKVFDAIRKWIEQNTYWFKG